MSRINKERRPLARGRICDSWVPPHPEPHPRLRRAVRWLKLRKPETSQWKREGKRKRGGEREKKKIERATDWSGGSELCSLAWTLRSCCRQEDKFVSLRRWLSHTVVVSHLLKKRQPAPQKQVISFLNTFVCHAFSMYSFLTRAIRCRRSKCSEPGSRAFFFSFLASSGLQIEQAVLGGVGPPSEF